MVLTPSETRALYRRLAPHYDRLVEIFRLVGADMSTYRRRTVDALSVSPGETVVDIRCGTGRNFPWLERAVTASGRIVGVDLSDAMLCEAQHRVKRAGWANVDLVETDVADYEFPANVGALPGTAGAARQVGLGCKLQQFHPRSILQKLVLVESAS